MPIMLLVIVANNVDKQLTLDLRTPAGVGIFKEMVSSTDIIISNFKPGTMEEWGLGFEDLRELNAGIIWEAAGSTFGPDGPDADRPGGRC